MFGTKVTASEFRRSYGAICKRALQEPVTITKCGRKDLVLISSDEYWRLKRRDRQTGFAHELPDELAKAVEEAEVPKEYRYLDALLDP